MDSCSMIGDTVSHCSTIERPGGGMGVVCKVEDTTLDRFHISEPERST